MCPVAINAFIARGDHNEVQMEYAEYIMKLIVQAILITTPIGFLLTNHLGPILLKEKQKNVKTNPNLNKQSATKGSHFNIGYLFYINSL